MRNKHQNLYLALGLVSIVFAAVFLVEGIEEYTLQSREPTPEYLELKAEPSRILYSKAYKSERGGNEILYAFLDEQEPDILPNEDVRRRTPSSQTVVIREFQNEAGKPMEELMTVFTAAPQFYKTESGQWRQIEYATTTQEVFSASGSIQHIVRREFLERLAHYIFGVQPVFAVTSTFFPDADPESTSVDGNVNNSDTTGNCSTQWTTVRNATAGSSAADSATTANILAQDTTGERFNNCQINRAFLLFDTSALGASADISSATLSVYVTLLTNSIDAGSANIITTTPASNTAIVTGDFDQVGSTLQASSVAFTVITTSAYNDFPLNATGLTNISKTGITKFGMREGHDLNNVVPSESANNKLTFSTAEETGTTQDPKLVVVYTLPASFAPWMFDPF